MAGGERDWPKFADYRVVDRIGVGGMGEVFLARRHGAGELCVLKRLRPEVVDLPDARARFLREAEVCSLLSHPNIARLLDARIEGNEMFLAFEHVAGRDLEAIAKVRMRAKMSPMPIPLVVELGAAVLEGLGAAHEQRGGDGQPLNIVHRDIGLRNLMISYSGEVKIIDFGLVRATLGDLRTRTGALMGTPRFMSPEQATGERVDRRGDLYSLGVVLFELLAGRVFIKGNTPIEILRGILDTPVPKISKLNPELPKAFDEFFETVLAKLQEDRYSTAHEMEAALRAAAKTIPPPANVKEEMASMLAPLFTTDRARVELALDEAHAERVEAPPTRVAPLIKAVEEPILAPTVISEPVQFSQPRLERNRRGSTVAAGIAMFAAAAAISAVAFAVLRNDEQPLTMVVVDRQQENTAPKIEQRPVQEISQPRARVTDAPPQIERTPELETKPQLKPELKPESKVRPETKVEPKTEVKVERAPLRGEKPVVSSFEDIRALLTNGEPRSLVAAEEKIRAASDDLPGNARDAIANCLTSATTAPNATVWRQGLGACLERLVRAHEQRGR